MPEIHCKNMVMTFQTHWIYFETIFTQKSLINFTDIYKERASKYFELNMKNSTYVKHTPNNDVLCKTLKNNFYSALWGDILKHLTWKTLNVA